MVVKRNPKYKTTKKRLKSKKTCYVCNRLIHFKKNCVSIPHNGDYIYRHDRCDANSKAWQRNKELNKPISTTKKIKVVTEDYLPVLSISYQLL
jgi:hypothetical protein